MDFTHLDCGDVSPLGPRHACRGEKCGHVRAFQILPRFFWTNFLAGRNVKTMKRGGLQITLLIILIGLIVTCFGSLARKSQPEPMFQGEPVSVWVEKYDPYMMSEEGFAQLQGEMREIGTNSLPTLMEMLQRKESPTKRWLYEFAWAHELGFLKTRLSDFPEQAKQMGDSRRCAAIAFEALGTNANPVIPELTRLLDDRELSQEVAHALAAIGPDALPPLLKGMESKDPEIRRDVAYALSLRASQAKVVVPVLVKALNGDPDTQVRDAAAQSLGEIHQFPNLAVPPLVKTLSDCGDSDIHYEAAMALGKFGDAAESAIPALIEATKESQDWVRLYAVESLGSIKKSPETVVPVLIKALDDHDYEVRFMAADALGNFGDKAASAVPRLSEAAEDENAMVRRSAVGSLGEMTNMSDKVAPILIEKLKDPDDTVRYATALALGQLDHEAAVVPALLNALKENEGLAKRGAVQALGNLTQSSQNSGIVVLAS